MSQKIHPPTCHVISPSKLKLGDHIYRRLNGVKAIVGYHHAVVSEVPKQYNNTQDLSNKIKVFEMTSKGIKERTLTMFLHEWDCRLVYYNTKRIYETLHASGTCHVEPSSPITQIIERIDNFRPLLNNENNNETLYNVFKINCEEFAIFIKTGLCKGAGMTQLINAGINASCCVEVSKDAASQSMTRIFSKVVTYTLENGIDDIAMATAKNLKSAAYEAGDKAGKEVLKKVKYGVKGAGIGIGIAVVVELACTAYKIYKYKTDYKYTKCDLKRDLGRGWIVTAVTAGIGVALMPIGWWAIIPCLAVGFGLNYLFHHFHVFDKSTKEKHYKEYGLNKKSSKKQLKNVRKALRKQIRNEKLHPDQWTSEEMNQLSDKEKKKKLEKFMFLKQLMEWLDEDIANGCVSFDDVEYIANAKTKRNPLSLELS